MRPTVRQLEYVVAVSEEASFSRAAQRCFVSQPALSNQVKQLEHQLGVLLFERTSRGVLTTPVGKDVVAIAREVLAASDRLVDRVAASRAPLCGPFELGSVSTITPYLVPAALPDLRARFPEMELRLRDGSFRDLEDQLASGGLDALVVPLPTGLPGCEEIELAVDDFVLAAPSDSELGAVVEPIRPDILAGHEILILEDPHCLRGHALEVCGAVGADAQSTVHANSLGVIVQLVSRGFGATLLPSIALPVEMAGAKGVSIKRFSDPVPGRTIGLAWRTGSPHAGAMEDLAAVLRAYARPAFERPV